MQMNVTPTAGQPFEIILVDTFTLEQSKFLIIIDRFSPYPHSTQRIVLH